MNFIDNEFEKLSAEQLVALKVSYVLLSLQISSFVVSFINSLSLQSCSDVSLDSLWRSDT